MLNMVMRHRLPPLSHGLCMHRLLPSPKQLPGSCNIICIAALLSFRAQTGVSEGLPTAHVALSTRAMLCQGAATSADTFTGGAAGGGLGLKLGTSLSGLVFLPPSVCWICSIRVLVGPLTMSS